MVSWANDRHKAMANPVLDLTPSPLDIHFQKGSTFAPVFYYLAPDYSVINLSDFQAKMQARADYTSTEPLTGWDLTTENGGLVIVQGTVTLPDGTVVTGAYGVQTNVAPEVTAAVTWAKAIYDCDIVKDGNVTPLVKGHLIPVQGITP